MIKITYFFILNKLIFADQVDFNTWLESFKKDAIKAGISSSTIDKNLTNVKLIPRVVELDRKQPEFTLTLRQYLKNVVNKNLSPNRDLIQVISGFNAGEQNCPDLIRINPDLIRMKLFIRIISGSRAVYCGSSSINPD